jgi:MSHA biogenesis protein MshQ
VDGVSVGAVSSYTFNAVSADHTIIASFTTTVSDWWNTEWLYRKEIIIDQTKVTENLINFPVFIDLTDNDLFSHAQSDGDDIVFTDNTTTPTKYSHEIETYNSENGHLVVWVKIPFLSSTQDTSIYMYYGNPSTTNQQDVEGTWYNGFKAVYHLKESRSTTAGHFKDSTSNNYDGTLTDANANSNTDAGVAGNGFRFNGDADYINIGVINHDYPITYSCWLKADNIDGLQCALGRYWNYYYLGIWNWGNGVVRQNIYVNGALKYSSKSGVSSNIWYLQTVTYDGARVRFYTNGAEDSNQVVTGSLSARTWSWHIGDDGNGDGFFFDGSVDEVRLSNACLSAGWIATYYRNVNNPSSFYSVGSEMIHDY